MTGPDLPSQSALWAFHRTGDFLDCYACDSPLPARAAAEVMVRFPAWMTALLVLRNLLVLPFGLKAGVRRGEGPRIGIFPVAAETAEEVVLGFDDRHLDFRLTVLAQAGRVYCATWVRPHNRLGRAYLAIVLPVHRLAMRDAVRRLARA